MPSRKQMWRRTLETTQVVPSVQPWVSHMNESRGDHVRLLAERRRTAFSQAATCRREGHLVPGSVTQELAETASELRGAIERYRKGCLQRSPDRSDNAGVLSPVRRSLGERPEARNDRRQRLR